MFAVTKSVGLFGMNAFPVTVEAEVSSGHSQFDISGLPDAAVKEARARVQSAVSSARIRFPAGKDINVIPFFDQILGDGKADSTAATYNKRFFHRASS